MGHLGDVSKNVRQSILILYTANSALDSTTIGWSRYDGMDHSAGDSDEPPYPNGVAALRDGWRLLQASQLVPASPGAEHDTSYLRYEFFFERLETCDDG